MKILIAFISILFFSSYGWSSARVIFLTGGPIDAANPPSIHKAINTFIGRINELSAETVEPLKAHQSKWRDICRELTEETPMKTDRDIILIGHSYGASSAVKLARCLNLSHIEVRLLITVDTVAKPGGDEPVTIIPDNVMYNFSYYQKSDLILRGRGPNIREDGGQERIYNYRLKMTKLPVATHVKIFTGLFKYGVMSELLKAALQDEALERLSEQTTESHRRLFQKYPVQEN